MSGQEPLSLPSVDGLALDTRLHRASGDARGVVVLVHGITADLDEGGMYIRLAQRLVGADYSVLRFSFRGHGESGGTQRGVTVAGEMLDLEAALTYARTIAGVPLTVVASSFGAVATLHTADYLHPDALVLWNPILDLRHTFVEPELEWGRQNFHAQAWAQAKDEGGLVVDDTFELGRALLNEFTRYNPGEIFARSTVPALIVHGDRDSYVSYDVARAAAQARGCDFHTVAGSDHGFDSRDREDEAISVTVAWIAGLGGVGSAAGSSSGGER